MNSGPLTVLPGTPGKLTFTILKTSLVGLAIRPVTLIQVFSRELGEQPSNVPFLAFQYRFFFYDLQFVVITLPQQV